MASVLGKRARTTESSEDFSISSRVKRRVYASTNSVNDENVDPTSVRNGKQDDGYDDLDLDVLDCSVDSQGIPSPARSAIGIKKVALSPRKANGQGKVRAEASKDANVVQLLTPKTPRHRDALSKRVPITPRHRVGLVGKPSTPYTPRTPSTPSNAPTVHHRARQLFTRGADPGPLVGRQEERETLCAFVNKSIRSRAGRCLYVSGPPGTGKSALVSEVCQNIQPVEDVRTAYINCMSAKCSKDVYSKLVKELLGDDTVMEDEAMAHLRDVLIPRKKTLGPVYIVTLDEIDFLLTLDLEVLYTLFEWSFHRSSRLVVIGIANALDLTDRFLPRLKARNLKPQLLPFLPYTAPQIESVITAKLKSLSSTDSALSMEYTPIIHQTAIQLCSKKVATQGGDLRKAFDIVRRTIDLVEAETKQKSKDEFACRSLSTSPSRTPLGENSNLCSPSRASLTHAASFLTLTPLTAPRATIAHVSRVAAAAFSNGTSQRLQTLNLQQKATLCALISHRKSWRRAASSIFATPTKASNAPSVRRLFEIYCTICTRDNALHAVTSTEFVDVISGLETLGLIGEDKGGRGFSAVSGTPSRKGKGIAEDKRVVCFVEEEDLKGCLDGISRGILMGLLEFDV